MRTIAAVATATVLSALAVTAHAETPTPSRLTVTVRTEAACGTVTMAYTPAGAPVEVYRQVAPKAGWEGDWQRQPRDPSPRTDRVEPAGYWVAYRVVLGTEVVESEPVETFACETASPTPTPTATVTATPKPTLTATPTPQPTPTPTRSVGPERTGGLASTGAAQ